MKYYVRLGRRGEPVEVELEGGRATMNGVSSSVRFAAIPGTPLYHLLLGEESWTLAVEPQDLLERWVLGVAGERIDVEVVDEATRHIQDFGGRHRARTGPETVHAPMPGLVVRIRVVEGQRVEAGAGLVVVEAMKMENELRASRAGVIAQVHVTVGQAIEKGTPLVTLDSAEPSG